MSTASTDPVAQAALTVLERAGEPLHWTVIQDRILRDGGIDPFTTPDVRRRVLEALRSLAAAGLVTKDAGGVRGAYSSP
jgi:hypothetical protein